VPTITIDGQTLQVEAGKTIIQAAHEAGIAIPYYCYHPGLVVDGNCRICLVEVERAPKLMVACKTAVQDGMVVRTQTERVASARRGVQEFMLINHPIDCPVCDQAGECKLQDYYYDLDLADSRFREHKVHKPKVVDFGEHVMFDGERCILCSRCVRFTRDISETHELAIFNRSDSSVIDLAPGRRLDNDYSMNTIDICPVGALTSRDFRFRKRVWMLDEVASVCPGCSRGCNVWLDTQLRESKVYRTRPRKNLLANEYWMCDYGRFMYAQAEHERLPEPRVNARVAAPEAAVAAAAECLRPTAPQRLGVLLSRWHSNEELAALQSLLATQWPDAVIALGEDRVPDEGETVEDDFLIEADKNPNAEGVRRLFGMADGDGVAALREALNEGRIDTLWVLARRAEAVLGETLQHAPHVLRFAAHAEAWPVPPTVEVPVTLWAEVHGSFTNRDGVISPFTPALRPPVGTSELLKVLRRLGEHLAVEVPGDHHDAWRALCERHPELGTWSWDELLEHRALAWDQEVELE